MKHTKLLIPLLSAALLAGCAKHEVLPQVVDIPQETSEEAEAESSVQIRVNMPSASSPLTYAMTPKQECDITAVDVLVFGPDKKFLYRETGSGITDGVVDNKRQFSVKIKKTNDPNRVSAMVVANARTAVDAALEGDSAWITAGTTTWDEVVTGLVFNLPVDDAEGQGGKWLVLPGRYTRFPMWGVTGDIDLTRTELEIPEVELLRAVARVDVGLGFPTSGTPEEQEVAKGIALADGSPLYKFFLEEVYLYNAHDRLRVIPDESVLSAGTVSAPSLPPAAGVYGTADDPIKYSVRPWDSRRNLEFIREIYLSEHAAGSDTDRPNNACIVVGGRYLAAGLSMEDYQSNYAYNSTNGITYYRVDFVKSTRDGTGKVTAQEYLPILRNHRYKVNILDVHDRGYDTPKEAFEAMGLNTNLTVQIVSTDEKVGELVFDGQYMLGVDKKEWLYDAREHILKEVYVNTDYPAGFKITSNVNWIRFADADGNYTLATTTGVSSGQTLRYMIAQNTTGADRVGTLTVQAGRLFMPISVKQTTIYDIRVTTKPAHYILAGDSFPQWFKVTSNYPWKARILKDEYNIITDYTKEATSAGETTCSITFVDDQQMQYLYDATAYLEFYSEEDAFTPMIYTVRGRRHWMNGVNETRFEPWVETRTSKYNEALNIGTPPNGRDADGTVFHSYDDYTTDFPSEFKLNESYLSSESYGCRSAALERDASGKKWYPESLSQMRAFYNAYLQFLPDDQVPALGKSYTVPSYEHRYYTSSHHINTSYTYQYICATIYYRHVVLTTAADGTRSIVYGNSTTSNYPVDSIEETGGNGGFYWNPNRKGALKGPNSFQDVRKWSWSNGGSNPKSGREVVSTMVSGSGATSNYQNGIRCIRIIPEDRRYSKGAGL